MPIYVRGVDEFTGKVRLFVSRVPGEVVQKTGKELAEETISAARPEVPVVSGRAAGSLREVMTASGAIAEGGEGVEYYAWLEYGGASGVGLSNLREVYGNGRYIYPAYESAVRSGMIKAGEDNLEAVLNKAGLDPH